MRVMHVSIRVATVILGKLLVSISASVALSIVVKVTIVLGIALLAVRVGHTARASLRHAILASGVCGCILVLPATFFLPVIEIPLVHLDASEWPAMAVGVSGSAIPANLRHVAPPAAPRASLSLSIAAASMLAWAIGTFAFLGPMAVALLRRRQILRSGHPWIEGQRLLSPLALQADVHREIELLRQRDLRAPMTCGVKRVAILLPMDATGWSDDDCGVRSSSSSNMSGAETRRSSCSQNSPAHSIGSIR